MVGAFSTWVISTLHVRVMSCSPIEKIVPFLLLLLISSSLGLQREKFVIQPHPVQFNEEPHDWTVTEGASVNLSCNTTVVRVIGYINEDTTPLPQIKWFHNDVMINSSGHFDINNYGIATSILTIRNVTSLEQGEYYCVVNEWVKPDGDWWAKTRSKSGHITVVGANSTLTVNIKEHVVLSCMEPTALVSSSGVVWTKDGVEMSENVTGINGNLLVIEVREDSSGHYQCIDQVKSTTLLNYSLTVDTAASRYLQQQELLIEDVRIENHFITIRHDADIRGCIGSPVNQSVTLTCKAHGHQEISWYKNGELLDLNSEGTTFNQTTGDLVIRREDACDLLGVYQCFAGNEIDTVHVSTRVLPFGWANHPGKPELIDLKSHDSNRFELRARVRPPDYLAGLSVESISYDVFLADGGESPIPNYQDTINASKASEGVLIQLRKDFINGLGVIENVYYLKVSIRLNNKSLSSIVALPDFSPHLRITTICTFIGNPPPPVIMETCKYDNISDLVTHNISWYVESLVEGITYKFRIGWWKIYGGCTYPNGTTAGKYFDDHMAFRSSYSWKLPRNSVCNVSIFYEIFCGSASSYLTESCDERAALGFTGVMIAEAVGNKNTPVMLAASLAPVLVMIAIISIVLIYLCYRKCSRHKRSALKMLKNVEEINKLQASCPITVDQQSVDGTKSELYIEKVTRWMEYVSEEPLDDSDSVLEGCSLGTSEMLDQIVEGRAARNVDDIPNESHDEAPSLTSCRKCDIKKRLQSADSGMESEGNGPCIGPNLFQKYCQRHEIKDESISTNHDHFNKLENKTLDRVGLQSTSGSNLSGPPRLIVNNHDDIAERVDGYVGLEVVNESFCAEKVAYRLQLQVEVNQNHHLSKSTQKVNSVVDQDQCLLKLTKDYVESEVVDQNQYLPKSTENFDYVGLEVVDQDQCLPKSTEKFDHVEVEVTDQNLCLPKSIENFDYVGLEAVDQDDQEQHLIKSIEKFECDKLEAIDQNQCLCKSTDNFDYVGLEVVDQDHYLPRPVETVNTNHMSDDYVGLEQVDKLNDIQNRCMPKSTDKFGDYIETEADQGHSMSRSSEKFGNYIGLEVACQDQCVCRSAETIVDCLTVEIVPGWTEKVEDTADQCHSTSRSTGDDQNCCYQGGHEGSLSSTSTHDDGALHYALQYNDDGYVMSPVLTGLYCS